MASWQFWIDVGGTFTDCIGQGPSGERLKHKLLSSGATKGIAEPGSDALHIVDSTRRGDPVQFWAGYRLLLLDRAGSPVAESTVAGFDPQQGLLTLDRPLVSPPSLRQAYELVSDEEAPVVGIRYMLGLERSAPLPSMVVRLGTTRGTNALITRRGAKTAFVTTSGFGDVLRIGYQNRPKLFELDVRKPEPLFAEVAEIDERITPDGTVLRSPDAEAIAAELGRLKAEGIESLAICLLNAYAQPRHEELVGEIAEQAGFEEVSLSSRVAPLVKIVSRGDTTVMDAYLNPVLRSYVRRLRRSIGSGRLQILTSAGGLVEAEQFVGKDSILSGPAGGVVGFSQVARSCGFTSAIGFDMGGTSTDVSRFEGRYELEYETEKAGVRVVAPMMAIETVAAGGGSICRFDGVKLTVGPDSAGADPGPACYGRGGPLAVTDLNLFQGRILPSHFPFSLDTEAVRARLGELRDEVRSKTGTHYHLHELAEGLLKVANANMVKAIRSISIAKGRDPRDYVLVAFGGAAGQHACSVARELSIGRVLCHADGGILSAYGIGLADVVRHRARGVYRPYSQAEVVSLDAAFAEMADEARGDVVAEGVPAERIEVRRLLDLRYRGLDAYLTIREPDEGTFADAYGSEHARLYGYEDRGRPLEIVAARVEVVGRSAQQPAASSQVPGGTAVAEHDVTAWFDARPCDTGVFLRRRLQPGQKIVGPAIVCETTSTTVIEPGWQAEVLSGGELLLAAHGRPPAVEISTEADPVMLEVFNNQFAGIAEQMGITLRNTSSSVNVKERLDFSCAIFTAKGELVVNAPHIPVHLGAMGQTVRVLVAETPDLAPGDVLVTNDPYRGGSHLPDVTVVSPVHNAEGRLLFFTASRAHHAEIGGIVPGSMPPLSRSLAEEGVLIEPFKVVAAGRLQIDRLRQILTEAPLPTRSPDDNIADLTAQIAANRRGADDLLRLVDRYGLAVVEAYMGHIRQAAETKMRTALARLPDGLHRYTDYMDDGSPISVSVDVQGDRAVIDFTGTGPVVPGNLNANRAIVTAAVMYVLRCLIDEEIPLNEGVLAPVEIVLPECLLNPPRRSTPAECAAVVGGNVETSQRVVDALLGALGVAAASQGTMNNVMFGGPTFGYYETICGGAGATSAAPGADAVHTHMTNTRLTDPEVLEQRYPVRVLEFSIRRGSGGRGRHAGGCGVIRRIEMLAELELSILSQRRGPYAPFGLQGGGPGALGRNCLVHLDGTPEELPGLVQRRVKPGEILVVTTPGGGGFKQP